MCNSPRAAPAASARSRRLLGRCRLHKHPWLGQRKCKNAKNRTTQKNRIKNKTAKAEIQKTRTRIRIRVTCTQNDSGTHEEQ